VSGLGVLTWDPKQGRGIGFFCKVFPCNPGVSYIGDDGTLAGSVDTPTVLPFGGYADAPAIWTAGNGPTKLALPSGYVTGGIESMNRSGLATGGVQDTSGQFRIAEWGKGGHPTILNSDGFQAFPTAIDAGGNIAGRLIVNGSADPRVWSPCDVADNTLGPQTLAPGQAAQYRESGMAGQFVTGQFYDSSFKEYGFVAPMPIDCLRVNTTADSHDAQVGDGVCSNSGGDCSFRAAIEEAKASEAIWQRPITITFKIPSPALQHIRTTASTLTPVVINESKDLPPLAPFVNVDARTEAIFRPYHLIVLKGPGKGTGLSLSHNDVVDGMSVTGFDTGVAVTGDSNTVLDSWIGFTGTGALGGNGVGVSLMGSGNTIGQYDAISGNGVGVLVKGASATGNYIEGDDIGTDSTGTATDEGNGTGVKIVDAGSNTILEDTIAANKGNGVEIQGVLGKADRNTLLANYIGTNMGGASHLGNRGDGVSILHASETSVGVLIPHGGGGAGNVISGNLYDGVSITGADSTGNLVQANKIGTTHDGKTALGNLRSGVLINNSPGNTVGGTDPNAANAISGNNYGLTLLSLGATKNLIQGNLIGTTADGSSPLPNRNDGVEVNEAPGNTIGGGPLPSGKCEAPCNVISANGNDGIHLVGASKDELIQGNVIGANQDGDAALGNGYDGVQIENALGPDTIGGADKGNVVSASKHDGVSITGTLTKGDQVQGNLIGTDVTGKTALGNKHDGVFIATTMDVTIGGKEDKAGNVISGSGNWGIELQGTGTTGNSIQRNMIGSDREGMAALPNKSGGIYLNNVPKTTIGGAKPVHQSDCSKTCNLISGNDGPGVLIFDQSARGEAVAGNYIGTTLDGSAALPNQGDGVKIDGSPQNTIGGSPSCQLTGKPKCKKNEEPMISANLISGNVKNGVEISGQTATKDMVIGNLIGLDAGGSVAVGNGMDGVFIDNASGNRIGGTRKGDGNIISGNTMGIALNPSIVGQGGNKNTIQGNYIGTSQSGSQAVPNRQSGIYVSAPGNTIGGASAKGCAGPCNLISGNGGDGVFVASVRKTVVQGNYLGTDLSGSSALGNGLAGIAVLGAPLTTLGGSKAGQGNLVSGNSTDGIQVTGASTGAIVAGNIVGSDASGNSALPNARDGIRVMAGGISISGNQTRFNKKDGIHVLAAINVLLTADFASGNKHFDAQDETRGSKTAHTANTWTKVKCKTSSPKGLCIAKP
jgi:titin